MRSTFHLLWDFWLQLMYYFSFYNVYQLFSVVKHFGMIMIAKIQKILKKISLTTQNSKQEGTVVQKKLFFSKKSRNLCLKKKKIKFQITELLQHAATCSDTTLEAIWSPKLTILAVCASCQCLLRFNKVSNKQMLC